MIGATGLTGRSIVPLIEADHQLHLLGRRRSGFDVRDSIGEMREWPALLRSEPVDVAISALGTTWRQAGSWPEFAAVDHVAVVDFARAARAAGATQFITISAVGADPKSRNAYLALKGRVEGELASIGFERLDIMRPGLLRGPRGSDRRRGERLAIRLSPITDLFMLGRLDRFASIEAAAVAAAVASLVGRPGKGRHVHHNRELRALAELR